MPKYQIIKMIEQFDDGGEWKDTEYRQLGPMMSLKGCENYIKATIPITEWWMLKLQPYEQDEDGNFAPLAIFVDPIDEGLKLTTQPTAATEKVLAAQNCQKMSQPSAPV